MIAQRMDRFVGMTYSRAFCPACRRKLTELATDFQSGELFDCWNCGEEVEVVSVVGEQLLLRAAVAIVSLNR